MDRLNLAGLRSRFDDAARARDRSEMIRVLQEVEVSEASWFVDMIIANPQRYGY
jgi:hypothetical protein